jgi:hypothetical protein
MQIRLPFGLDQSCAVPISSEEIVILGGRNYAGTLKESFLFNMRTESLFTFSKLNGKLRLIFQIE